MSKMAAKLNIEAADAVLAAGRQPTVERAAMAITSSWSVGFVHGELAFWDYDKEVWSSTAPKELINACGADDESWPYVKDAIKKLCDLKQTKMATSEQIVAAKLPDAIARTIALGEADVSSPLGDDFKTIRAAAIESMRSDRVSIIPGYDDFDTVEKIVALASGDVSRASLSPKRSNKTKWIPGRIGPNSKIDSNAVNKGIAGNKLVVGMTQSASAAIVPNIDSSIQKRYPKTVDTGDVVAWLRSRSNALTSEPSELVKVIMASITPTTTILPNTMLIAAYYGLLELTGGTTDYSARALSLIFARLFERHGFKPLQSKPRRTSAYVADGLFDAASLGFLEMTPAVAEAKEQNAPTRALVREITK